jgi:hypothetical protein
MEEEWVACKELSSKNTGNSASISFLNISKPDARILWSYEEIDAMSFKKNLLLTYTAYSNKVLHLYVFIANINLFIV